MSEPHRLFPCIRRVREGEAADRFRTPSDPLPATDRDQSATDKGEE